MSIKTFYDRNAAFVPNLADVDEARIELETPGTRYHCVSDQCRPAFR